MNPGTVGVAAWPRLILFTAATKGGMEFGSLYSGFAMSFHVIPGWWASASTIEPCSSSLTTSRPFSLR